MAAPAPLHVLHIEDSTADALLISAALARAGYALTSRRAATPAEFEAALQDAKWDVVLSDYSLPHFDAPQALAILHASGQDLPFIIVSGTIDEEQAVGALRAGAHDFVTKGHLARLAPAIERERREAGNRRQVRQAQQMLREQEASFRLLFESNPLPMWVYDTETLGFLEVNASATAHYGYSRAEFLALRITDIRLPEDVPALLAFVKTESQALRPADRLWRHRLKNGQLIDVEITSHPIVYRGRPAAMIVANDISQRQSAAAALAASERRFRSITENSSDAISLLGPNGRLQYISASTGRILGYTPEEMLGADPALFTHPDDLPALLQLLQTLMQQPNATVTTSYRFRHQDGTWRWLEASIRNLLADPSVGAIVFNYRDVTERKEFEAALQLAETKYRTLIEQIPAITYVAALNENSSPLYISPQVSKLGYTAEEHMADPTLWSESIYPDDRARVAAELALATQSGRPLNTEYRVRGREGREFWIRDEAVIVRDAAGQPLFIQGVLMDVTERKQAETKIQLQLDRLGALRAIDLAIIGSLDLPKTLDIFLEQVIGQLGVHAADILLADANGVTFRYAAGRGFRSSYSQQAIVRLGEGRAGRAALEQRIIAESLGGKTHLPSPRTGLLWHDEFTSYYGVPLIVKGRVLGVLELFNRSPLQPDREWLEFLDALAAQAAIAIENASLFGNLQRSHQDLISAYDKTIAGWSAALDLRDKETKGHSQRVTDLTLRVAAAFKLDANQLIHVRRGALLHDIGKMGVPDNILLKPGPLTDEEWEVMRRHPTYAFELLNPIDYLREALEIPYCHHEKWDGSGYPRGLRGVQIPLAARLFAVVDVWDALTSERPYRAPWSRQRVLAHIQALAGSHFDPRAVEAFIGVIDQAAPARPAIGAASSG